MDFNGDGHQDLLSGSWPGELFFFQGGPDRSFAAPVKLKDKSGKTINIGGGVRDSGRMVLVAGDAKFEKTEKGETVIVYEGERIEIPEGKQGGITGTASAVHATDWDGDGDLDLIVGDGEGGVSLFDNVGARKKPKLAAARRLVSPGETSYGADAPKQPRRGVRSKVCVTDYNGDGRLDLLLGDFATQQPDLPEPTPEQKAEQDKLRKELTAVRAESSKLMRKLFGPTALKDKKERDEVQTEYRKVSRRMLDLRSKLPPEYENHGWVWLFVRKSGK